MAFLLFFPLALLSMAAIYLLVVAIWSRKKIRPLQNMEPNKRFAVVVPAHDEQKTIGRTLRSLKEMSYPGELFEIIVIADNCTDHTAIVVRESGFRCLERKDETLRGKGFALQYAFSVLLRENFDAFAVVDADTVVDVNFLNVMNACMMQGDEVAQSRYGVTNPDDTPLSYMLAVGITIENDLFLKGREAFGFPAILRGNGMCFAAKVLRDHPWEASSVVEDTEYSLYLLRKGVNIRLVPQVSVNAPIPGTLEQASGQRIRWASGNSRLTKQASIELIRDGIRMRSMPFVEMGWSLLIRSKPLLIFLSFVLFFLCAMAQTHIGWSFALVVFFLAYLLAGMVLLGLDRARLRLACSAPFYLAWLTCVSLLGLTGFRSGDWVRTKRS